MRLNLLKDVDGKQIHFATIESDAIPVVGEEVKLDTPAWEAVTREASANSANGGGNPDGSGTHGAGAKGLIVRKRAWNFFGTDLSVDVHLEESSGL